MFSRELFSALLLVVGVLVGLGCGLGGIVYGVYLYLSGDTHYRSKSIRVVRKLLMVVFVAWLLILTGLALQMSGE